MEDQWTRRVWPPPKPNNAGPNNAGPNNAGPNNVVPESTGRENAGRESPARESPMRHGVPPSSAAPMWRGDPAWPADQVWPTDPIWPADQAWPSDPALSDEPPAAGRYGAPVRPGRRMPRWLSRLLVAVLALVSAGTVIGAVVVTVLSRAEGEPPRVIDDALAGISYALPAGWSEGVVAPVTGFTSVAAHGDLGTVMARPGDPVDPPHLRSAVIDLTDLYTRLLLHGDDVEVVDDHAVTVNGRPGHTRAIRAEYRDVVNEPAFLRVTLLTRPDGKSTVMLALAHPDAPGTRSDIDALISGVH